MVRFSHSHMRRTAWIFLAAVLLPSLVLGWLAVRSARDQQVILEHQQVIINQNVTDALARQAQEQLESSRQAFIGATEKLLQKSASPQELARNFNQKVLQNWDLAEVGFAVDLDGTIYSPRPQEGTVARSFRAENEKFLSNRENVEVFTQNATQQQSPAPQQFLTPAQQQLAPVQQAVPMRNAGQPTPPLQNAQGQQLSTLTTQLNRNDAGIFQNSQTLKSNQGSALPVPANNAQAAAPTNRVDQNGNNAASLNNLITANQVMQPAQSAPPQQAVQAVQQAVSNRRQVVPKNSYFNDPMNSRALPEESDFRRVIGQQPSGFLARFLQDKLRLMVWYHPNVARAPVFGAQLSQEKFIVTLQSLMQPADSHPSAPFPSSTRYCLAILDDRGKPVAVSIPGFNADWKHPFVATEIGEGLPHWEAALYLTDPQQISRSASTLRLTVALMVAVMIAAILFGGWLMAADIRRQMQLAQQKTDFVSNVSHELKTPLTSIRMFADMLAEGRVTEPARRNNYLRIISAESARLTRLINNVLDFARLDRNAPQGERQRCDLAEIAGEVADTCRPHLEAMEISLDVEVQSETLPVMGERDALAQIILNLLSNAEKYGGREILVVARREESPQATGFIDVLDRGPGIPAKKRETVFKPFQRLDDSLSSGVSGSGLGLTLARRMARAHGGDVTCSPRVGGGSCFTLSVPLLPGAS